MSRFPKGRLDEHFIPCTLARAIGSGVFFRPVKFWACNTYAGEGLYELPNHSDRSGCLVRGAGPLNEMCSRPFSVTHRLYWHERDPKECISAFLSYPDGMGYSGGKYFWEALGVEGPDETRYFGDGAELEMEEAIKAHFAKASR